jgi:hypothetical protein
MRNPRSASSASAGGCGGPASADGLALRGHRHLAREARSRPPSPRPRRGVSYHSDNDPARAPLFHQSSRPCENPARKDSGAALDLIESGMSHITGHDRSQTLLLPESVDNHVGPENPVRFIDAFVDGLDLMIAGFTSVVPKWTGRPGYAPSDAWLAEGPCRVQPDRARLHSQAGPQYRRVRREDGRARVTSSSVTRTASSLCHRNGLPACWIGSSRCALPRPTPSDWCATARRCSTGCTAC